MTKMLQPNYQSAVMNFSNTVIKNVKRMPLNLLQTHQNVQNILSKIELLLTFTQRYLENNTEIFAHEQDRINTF